MFSAIYRVEIGAWFRILYGWFTSCLHSDIHGGDSGHEASEVSWDAQADLEHALINRPRTVLLMVDYYRFFDSFDHSGVKQFLRMLHFPDSLLEMVYNMHAGPHSTIKIGLAYGDPFAGGNGMGQGDVTTLFPELALVSGQFCMVNQQFPSIRMGACIDDPNFRGPLGDILCTYDSIAQYDKHAGHLLQTDKTAIAATHQLDRDHMWAITFEGVKPNFKHHDVLVGDIVTSVRRITRVQAKKRTKLAYDMTMKLNGAPVDKRTERKAIATAILPRAIHGTQWGRADFVHLNQPRGVILKGAFGPGGNLRSLEVLLTCFLDPIKADPLFATLYCTFIYARKILRKNQTRYYSSIEDISNPSRLTAKATGPVAGIEAAAKMLGIEINVDSGKLVLYQSNLIQVDLICSPSKLLQLCD